MNPNANTRLDEADISAIREYLASPSPEPMDSPIRQFDDEDDVEPGIPSGYLERSSETRRSPVPRRR